MLPDPNRLIAEIDFDHVSALVLAAAVVGASEGKLTPHNLRDVVVPVGEALGWKLSFDELHRLAEAAGVVAHQLGPQALEVALSGLSAGPLGTAAAYAAAGVAHRLTSMPQTNPALRAICQRGGVPLDGAPYFQLIQLAHATANK